MRPRCAGSADVPSAFVASERLSGSRPTVREGAGTLQRARDATAVFDDNHDRSNSPGDIDGKKIEGIKRTKDRTSVANQTLSEGVAQADQRLRQAKGEVIAAVRKSKS